MAGLTGSRHKGSHFAGRPEGERCPESICHCSLQLHVLPCELSGRHLNVDLCPASVRQNFVSNSLIYLDNFKDLNTQQPILSASCGRLKGPFLPWQFGSLASRRGTGMWTKIHILLKAASRTKDYQGRSGIQ